MTKAQTAQSPAPTTGSKLWSKDLGIIPGGAPVATLGHVYLNGDAMGGLTLAVNGKTGDVVWNFAHPGGPGSVAVANGKVWIAGPAGFFAMGAMTGNASAYPLNTVPLTTPAAYQGNVWAYSPWGGPVIDSTGKKLGELNADKMAAYHGGLVFYLKDKVLRAIDAMTFEPVWSFTGDGNLCTPPVVAGAGGQAFVGSSSGQVYELDRATGDVKSFATVWKLACGGEEFGMSIASNHLVVPAEDGLVVF